MALIPLLLQSCFTGVESTPKITYRQVKENNADKTSDEASFAQQFVAEKFSDWRDGKRLYVTSDRINLILSADTPGRDVPPPAEGDTLVYRGTREITDLTGKKIVEMLFAPANGGEEVFSYRTEATAEELGERPRVEMPFTIDLDLVGKVRGELTGRKLYLKTPVWYDKERGTKEGRKFIPVTITDIVAANEVYPFLVQFTTEDGENGSVFMSANNGGRWTPREFAAIFSFTDPHLEYPKIQNAMWDYIIRNRVTDGMTKTEAALALGNPMSIDRGHDHSSAYERWRYSDGVYLVFEDGLLVRHNK